MSLSLYKIADEYVKVMDHLYESDFDEQTINDTLESMSGDLEQKSINVAAYIKNLDAEYVAIKSAIDELNVRMRVMKNKSDHLKGYLFDSLRRCNRDKVNSPLISISIQNNPSSVDITNLEDIPGDYIKIETSITADKNLIRQALKDGIAINGCRLVQTQRLVIK